MRIELTRDGEVLVYEWDSARTLRQVVPTETVIMENAPIDRVKALIGGFVLNGWEAKVASRP